MSQSISFKTQRSSNATTDVASNSTTNNSHLRESVSMGLVFGTTIVATTKTLIETKNSNCLSNQITVLNDDSSFIPIKKMNSIESLNLVRFLYLKQ